MPVDEVAALALGGDALAAAAAKGGARLRVLPDRDALYADFAAALLGEVRAAAAAGRDCRLIVPVGPRGQYPHFVRLCNEGRVDLGHVHLFAMDEYLDWQGRYIPADDPLSFRGFLRRALVEALAPGCGFAAERLVFPDPLDPDAYSRRIAEVGGIDCCFGGIGVHGHVAFNEAPASRFFEVSAEALAASLTRVVPLAPETIVMNSIRGNGGDFARFPPLAVTAGMRDILAARRIRLYCDGGAWQRSVLRRAMFGPRSAAWPVTLLRGHPDYEIAADGETAAAVEGARA
jgi:glucosamine-6-phosphate deaminase